MNERILFLCKPSKDCQIDSRLKLSPETKAHIKGESRKTIYHYTNINALLKILDKGEFRFSRVDSMNDPMEQLPLKLNELYKRTFLASFGYETRESIPMWSMYTNKGFGVRIGLYFTEDKIHNQFADATRGIVDENGNSYSLINHDPESKDSSLYMKINDVIYEKEFKRYRPYEMSGDCRDVLPDRFCVYKSNDWKYEKETRLMIFMGKNQGCEDDVRYLFVPINFSQLKRVEVRFDPYMDSELKACLKAGIKMYEEKWDITIQCRDSELEGKIV